MSVNFRCSCRSPLTSTSVHKCTCEHTHMYTLPCTYKNKARGIFLQPAELVKQPEIYHNLWSCVTNLESTTFGVTTRREIISEGFAIIPLVTGTTFLLSFPWTYSNPLSNAGRWYASYSADYHQDPCRAGCSRKLFLGIYPLSPAHCKASVPIPQNTLCTCLQTIYKLSGSQKAWHTAPALFFSYFKGTETVFTS